MIQRHYKAHIISRFMDASEMAEFDERYQAAKQPTANNLGELTMQQLVEIEVAKVFEKNKHKPVQTFLSEILSRKGGGKKNENRRNKRLR